MILDHKRIVIKQGEIFKSKKNEGLRVTIKRVTPYGFSTPHTPISGFDNGDSKAQRHTIDVKLKKKVYLNVMKLLVTIIVGAVVIW